MRIGGEVPGGGSILLSGSKAMSEYGVPLPRIVNHACDGSSSAGS